MHIIAILNLSGETSINEVAQCESVDINLYEVDESVIEDLVLLYGLYKFSDKVAIISLTEPYNTGAERLLGVYGTTKEDLLCFDIYGFDHLPDRR